MLSINTVLLVEVVGEGLYTWDAYQELRLQMSTGTFHTHRTNILNVDASLEYTDIDDAGDFYIVNEDV